MKTTCYIILTCFVLQKTTAQCSLITIAGKYQTTHINYDKDGRLFMLHGEDKDEDNEDAGPHTYYFTTTAAGLTIPAPKQKEFRGAENGDGKGNYMLYMGDEDHKSTFKIDAGGKLVYWDYLLTEDNESSLKQTNYTYDTHGNLLKMSWKGKLHKATDEGELTATFNLSKPDVPMRGGAMRFLIEMPWLLFPMTNSNQITGWSYTQTIVIPEQKIVTGTDKTTGADIIKTIPEKKMTHTISRSFSYTYNAGGEVTAIIVTHSGKSDKYTVTYSNGNCGTK